MRVPKKLLIQNKRLRIEFSPTFHVTSNNKQLPASLAKGKSDVGCESRKETEMKPREFINHNFTLSNSSFE